MRTLALILSMLLGATPVLAETPPCSLQGLQPIPLLEKAKTHFLNGRYKEFSETLRPVIALDERQYNEIFGPISRVAGKGYDSCSTVLRRQDEGGLVQELVLFSGLNRSGRQDQILSLYLVAAPVDGDLKLLLFSMKETIGAAMDEVK